jgi:phage repressor protein C with HTH and peptisase S24 domain
VSYCQDREFIEELQVFSLPDFQRGSFRAFEIMGDSMELTIISQDWVVCERVQAASQLKDGAIYVIITPGNILCKRIVNQVKKRGLLLLKSDNTTYEDQTLEPDEILEMWLVRARLTKDFRSIYTTVKFLGDEMRRLEKMTESLIEMHKKQ